MSGEPSIWQAWTSYCVFLDFRCIPPHIYPLFFASKCRYLLRHICLFSGASKVQTIEGVRESTFNRYLSTEINVVDEAATIRSIVDIFILRPSGREASEGFNVLWFAQQFGWFHGLEMAMFACFLPWIYHQTRFGSKCCANTPPDSPPGPPRRYLPTVLALVVCLYSLKITKDQDQQMSFSWWIVIGFILLDDPWRFPGFSKWTLGEAGSVVGCVECHLTEKNWKGNIVLG